jgi:hypothetical protein
LGRFQSSFFSFMYRHMPWDAANNASRSLIIAERGDAKEGYQYRGENTWIVHENVCMRSVLYTIFILKGSSYANGDFFIQRL